MRKNIFKYHDGVREVFGDPLAINRKFTVLCDGDPNKFLKDTSSELDGVAIPAIEKVLKATREAFELPAFDRATGEGATDEVVFDVLNSFLDWMQKKSPTGESSPTSPAPTDVPPTQSASSPVPAEPSLTSAS